MERKRGRYCVRPHFIIGETMSFKVIYPIGEQLEYWGERLLDGITFCFRTDVRWILYKQFIFRRDRKIIQGYFKKYNNRDVAVLCFLDNSTYKSNVYPVIGGAELPYALRCQIHNFLNNPELFIGE